MAKLKGTGKLPKPKPAKDKSAEELRVRQQICTKLKTTLELLIADIGKVKIATKEQLPFGWRKAAKGRTVWRIFEEIISQALEKNPSKYKLEAADPATAETGIYDVIVRIKNIDKDIHINIKSAGTDRKNMDDISKAAKIVEFFQNDPKAELYIVTFSLQFNDDLTVEIVEAFIMPVCWIPDLYVNPSNNGNLQSAHCKDISKAVKRTNRQFVTALKKAIKVAEKKKTEKKKKEETPAVKVAVPKNVKTVPVKKAVIKKNKPKAPSKKKVKG